MSKLYTRVPVQRFPKSTFSQSRPVAGSMSAQRLYCTNAKEVLPADDWRAASEAFVRVQPLVAPVLAKLSVHQEAFYVPFWQINDHFEEFITRGERGTYNEKMPHITVSTLYDLISYLLNPDDDFIYSYLGFTSDSKVLDVYQFVVDKVVRIIELSDWFRSVPFVQPEFLNKPSLLPDANIDATLSDWEGDFQYTVGDIFSDARSFFDSLNGHLYGSTLIINLAPYFAALKVYCEFYRDENLVEDWWDGQGNWKDICFDWTGNVSSEPAFDTSMLDEHGWKLIFALFCVKNRAWSKDRFTSALPFVQKGPDVILPLSGTAPVDFTTANGSGIEAASLQVSGSGTSRTAKLGMELTEGVFTPVTAKTNFDAATLATTIRDFRTANKLEEFYEADGIGGSRYPENTLVQWGERTPDARLPRAQFLGSFSQPVSIAEVLQNSATNDVSPQGNLAGKATSYGRGFLFAKHFSMHGFLLFFTSIKTGAIYEQGINPMFSRYDWTEYAWPRFAHLGEEPIYTKELAVNSDVAEDTVFGYAPRYSDYKSDQGSIHGQLKSTLNFWTMSRRFANTPALNEEFIYGDPRRDSFAVVNPFAEQFIVEIDYKIKTRRKLPFFGVPSL